MSDTNVNLKENGGQGPSGAEHKPVLKKNGSNLKVPKKGKNAKRGSSQHSQSSDKGRPSESEDEHRKYSKKSQLSLTSTQGHTSVESFGSGGSKDKDEEESWNMFIDESNVIEGDDENLVESSPLFEMANVEINVDEALAEMKDALTRSLAQSRVSEREKTVLLDKFSLFLQALVSFQENEVELIDSIGMKMQIMEVLNKFIEDEKNAAELMLTGRKDATEHDDTKRNSGDLIDADEQPPPEEQAEGGVKRDAGGVSIDEMSATVVRENLLRQKNKLEMQEQMKVIHLLEIKQLEFEKTLLNMHYAKMTKPGDLQREMKELRKSINDLKLEVSATQQEISQLQLDITAETKSLVEDERVANQLDLDTLTKQMDVQNCAAKPLYLSKEADREAHKLEQLQDTLEVLNESWLAGITKFRIIQSKIDQKNSDYNNLIKEEGRMAHSKKLAQHEMDTVLTELESLIKKEQGLLNKCRVTAEKISINLKIKKKLNEEHHNIYNETTRAQREYQKLELTIRLAHDSHLSAKLAYDKMKSAFDVIQPKSDTDNWEKLKKMFIHEIHTLKNALNKKMADSSMQSGTVSQLQKKLNVLYQDQVKYGHELQDLMRTTVRKRREREEKAEQCIKLESQLFSILTDIRMQKVVLDDCARGERDLLRSLSDIQKKYSQVKIAKASVVTDLVQAREVIAQQVEKFKVANSEVDSYISQILEREKEIIKIHYLLLNAGLARDSVRNDALRAVQKFRFHRVERDEVRLFNNTIRKEIERLRKDILEIRIRFENAIQESAKTAIAVREKTEEVCTFIEKIRSYEMILLKGTGELRLRELEKTKLISILQEAQTHLIIITTKQPDENKIVERLERLRIQYFDITKERRDLEDELSNISKPGRVRELHHNWIEEREKGSMLKSKIRKLEAQLARRDLKILERELSLKQLDSLTESSIDKANLLKNKYECDVKVLVEKRKNIFHLSNRIDGLICETSYALSRAEAAEKKFLEMKDSYQISLCRFKVGKPPSRELENEWNHQVWQKEMLERSRVPKGRFLIEKPRRSGAQIFMERYRPKKKNEENNEESRRQVLPIFRQPQVKCCPTYPYKPSRASVSCNKLVLPRISAGIKLCER